MTPSRCRFCRSTSGVVVVDLGEQPGCEYFPPREPATADPAFPLRLWLCAECGLAQLDVDADVPEDPQGTQPDALSRQFAEAVVRCEDAGVLPATGTVREFASPHGGTWLPLLAPRGLTEAHAGAPADVVLDCCFGLMHEPDQRRALAERAAALAPGGVLLVQFHSLAAILERDEWFAVRHGHYAYHSVPAMRRMLADVGLTACTALWFPLYGGTVLLAARRDGRPDGRLEALTDAENVRGVLDPAAFAGLQDEVRIGGPRLVSWLAEQRRAGRIVHGYSAASRAVALLHSAGIGSDLLAAVADSAPAKRGTRIPGTDVPVVTPDDLLAASPDLVLLFVPDLLAEVRATVGLEARGGRWVTTDEILRTPALPPLDRRG